MKILYAGILLAIFSLLTFAQDASIESNFEKKKSKLKVELLSMGEDASSGYEYVIYKDKTQILKYRSIWSSSAGASPQVEDYYFENGKLVLFVKAALSKKLLKTAAKGRVVKLQTEEKLYFKDEKLTIWVEKGKTIPSTDARWKDKEKEVLEQAKGELDNYIFLKEN